jgi:fibronectin type 3 domain-containing protein
MAFGSVPALGQEKTIYVDNSVAAGGDGTSWASAYKYLQDALDDANATPNGTEVTLQIAEGIYYPDEDQDGDQVDNDENAVYRIKRKMSLVGGFPTGGGSRDPAAHLSILSGDIRQSSANADGIVERGYRGSGTSMSDELIIVEDVYGDASDDMALDPLLFDGIIMTGVEKESSTDYGALKVTHKSENPCRVAIRNSIIAGNFTGQSAVYLQDCTISVESSRFFGNVGDDGGALHVESDSEFVTEPNRIVNTSFENNQGDVGGAAYIGDSGFGSHPAETYFIGVTFHANKANTGYGGAIASDNIDPGNLHFENTVFAENEGSNKPTYHDSGDGTAPNYRHVIADVSLPAGTRHAGVQESTDPQLTASGITPGYDGPGRWTYPATIENASPAVNAGDASLLPADSEDLDGDGDTTEPAPLDAQGNVRVESSSVDIGAYESNSTKGSYAGGGPSITAPASLTATAGDGQVALTWSSVDGAVDYAVYRSTSSFTDVSNATAIATSVASTSYTDNTAVNGTTYYYAVAASDGSAESDPSTTQSSTPQDSTPPTLADDLAATAGEEELDLTWSASSDNDLDGYNLYRSTTSFTTKSEATKVNGSLLTSTSFTDGGLTNGQQYYYRYTAVDQTGNESDLSAEASAMPQDMTPPAAPNGLIATAGEGQVELAWNASAASDLDGYNLYRAKSSFSNKANATLVNLVDVIAGVSYTDPSVTNGQEYFYRLTAVDEAGNESDLSAAVSATPADVTAPDALTTLSATAGKGKVDLSWSESDASDKAGYNLYRAKSSFSDVSSATKMNESGLITAANFSDLSAESTFQYFYRVTVVDQAGNESGLSNEESATPQATSPPDATPPAKPNGLVAAGAYEKVSLSWNAGSEDDLAGYNVYRSTSAFTDKADAAQANGGGLIESTSFTDAGRVNGQAYYYRIEAVDGAGNASILSDMSSATPQDQVPPEVPTTLQAQYDEPAGAVALSWEAVSGATEYNVYRAQDPFALTQNATKLNGSAITGTSFEDPSIQKDVRYYYRITAVDAAQNESGLSNLTSFILASIEVDAPASVTATVQDGVVTITWNTAKGVQPGQTIQVKGAERGPSAKSGKSATIAGVNVYRSSRVFDRRAEAVRVNDEPITTGRFTDRPDASADVYYRIAFVTEDGEEGDMSSAVEVKEAQLNAPSAPPAPAFELLSFEPASRASSERGAELLVVTNSTEPQTLTVERSVQMTGETAKSTSAYSASSWEAVTTIETDGDGTADTHRVNDTALPYESGRIMYRVVRGDEVAGEVEVMMSGPGQTVLHGNYPNPFGQQTTLRYELAESGPVSITVYNALGQRVATIVEGDHAAGRHEVTWQPHSLASGLYLVRFEHEGGVTTQRMVKVR